MPGMGHTFENFEQWGPTDPQILQTLAIAVNYPQTLTVRPFDADGTYLRHRPRRNQVGTSLEASFLTG